MSILFKNLVLYRFTAPFELNAHQLEEKLNQKEFRPCGSQDMSTYGFVPALGKKTKALVHAAANSCMLLCAVKEEKLLPTVVINDAVQAKIDHIEQEQDRQVFSKERRALRDDAILELLPKAFTRQKHTLAYIDKEKGWLVVNAASFKQAEELTSSLRECLGSLPVTMPSLKNTPSFIMTRWLETSEPSTGFELCDFCELREPGDEGGTIIARREDITSNAISQHLEDGKQVSKLGIDYQSTFSGTLTDDLRFTRVKYSDLFKEKQDEQEADNYLQQMDVDFAIMSGTFRGFIKALVKAMGGEQ